MKRSRAVAIRQAPSKLTFEKLEAGTYQTDSTVPLRYPPNSRKHIYLELDRFGDHPCVKISFNRHTGQRGAVFFPMSNVEITWQPQSINSGMMEVMYRSTVAEVHVSILVNHGHGVFGRRGLTMYSYSPPKLKVHICGKGYRTGRQMTVQS